MNGISAARWLVVFGLLIAAVAAGAKEVPVANFFRPAYSAPILSPDGRYLAVVSTDPEHPGRRILNIINVQSKKVVHSFRHNGGRQLNRVFWIGNRKLAFSARLNGGNRFQTPGRLFAIDIDGNWTGPFKGSGYRFPQNISYRMVDPLPADPCHFIASSYAQHDPSRAFLFYVGGKGCDPDYYAVALTQSPFLHASFITDHDGRVRLAVGYDKFTGAPVWAYRGSSPDSKWHQLPSALLTPFGARPLGFTADNKRIYLLTAAKEGNRTLGLYEYDPHTDDMDLVYDDPAYDISVVMWGHHGTAVVALIVASGAPRLIFLNKGSTAAQILRAVASANPGMVPVIDNWTQDGSEAIVTVYGGRNPGLYYLVDAATLHAVLLLQHQPNIRPHEMAAVAPITVRSRDGFQLNGYLTLPNGLEKKGKPPLIVLPHDGPVQKDTWHFDSISQLFANRGYAVLQINYRGSSGRGEVFQQAGLHEGAGREANDVVDATEWAVNEAVVDGDRVCLYGSGYGANIALLSAEQAPDLYKCLVSHNGIYDLPLLVHKNKTVWIRPGIFKSFMPDYHRHLRKIFGTDSAVLEKQSSVNYVDKLKAALFLIQGDSDLSAPLAQAKALKARLDQVGKHYEYLYIPSVGRAYYNFDAISKTLKFLDQHIGPKAATRAR